MAKKSPPTFGESLRTARLERGLGLRALAERVGLSPTYLSRIEAGELAPPKIDKVVSLAKALDSSAFHAAALTETARNISRGLGIIAECLDARKELEPGDPNLPASEALLNQMRSAYENAAHRGALPPGDEAKATEQKASRSTTPAQRRANLSNLKA